MPYGEMIGLLRLMLSIRRLARRWKRMVQATFCTGDFASLLEVPGVQEWMKEATVRHTALAAQLADQGASSASEDLHRELGKLGGIVAANRELTALQKEMEDLQHLARSSEEDPEMQSYAKEELRASELKLQPLQKALLTLLVEPDEENDQDIVRAGVGGTEGALFALDLFQMYQKYTQLKRWKTEVMEMSRSELGGIKFASLGIAGKGVFGRLKVEAGVHRVQRVPVTEKAGRVQTSAASVVVMRQPKAVDVVVAADELRIDVYRSSGAGGQHVNTTESAVRITHLPTKISVAIQDERSQHKNKDKALRVLRAKLYELKKNAQEKEQSVNRKQSIGSGDRSARIRTYNYAQDRITDHRIQRSETGIQEMLSGLKLDAFVEPLCLHFQMERLREKLKSTERG